jgi:hypothetical protein
MVGMAKKGKPRKHRDRYDASGNIEAEYVDAEKMILKTKRGITDLRALQLAEEYRLMEMIIRSALERAKKTA